MKERRKLIWFVLQNDVINGLPKIVWTHRNSSDKEFPGPLFQNDQSVCRNTVDFAKT